MGRIIHIGKKINTKPWCENHMVLQQEQTNKPKEHNTVFRVCTRTWYTMSVASYLRGKERMPLGKLAHYMENELNLFLVTYKKTREALKTYIFQEKLWS